MKNIRIDAVIVLFCALLFASACQDDASNACTGGNFNFLTVGNHWESSFFGSFISSDTLILATVLEETEPGIFKLTTYTEPNNQLNGTYYLQDCGDFLLRSQTLPIKPEDQYMKGNRAVDDAWQYTDRTSGVVSNYKVLQKNVSVTTPVGTFPCDKISYHQSGTFNTDTIYLNNDYFFIKYSGIFEYELISKNF